MPARSSIKSICLTATLAAGLSLPGGALLAGGPMANADTLLAQGRKAGPRPGRGVHGYPEEFKPGLRAQQQRRGDVWKAPAGSDVATTMGGNPDGLKAGGGAASGMDESSPMVSPNMMDESSPLVFLPCAGAPGSNVATTMSGNPDGLKAGSNLTAQIDGITAQIDGFTPCGSRAGQPGR